MSPERRKVIRAARRVASRVEDDQRMAELIQAVLDLPCDDPGWNGLFSSGRIHWDIPAIPFRDPTKVGSLIEVDGNAPLVFQVST